jgi:hypothetical protein
LPDPLFKKDDVVRWGELILHIWGIRIKGQWDYQHGRGTDAWVDGGYMYSTTVQAGKGPTGKAIRPGIILTYPEDGSPGHQICDAEKIEWDQPIIEPDDMKNLAERQDAWEEE